MNALLPSLTSDVCPGGEDLDRMQREIMARDVRLEQLHLIAMAAAQVNDLADEEGRPIAVYKFRAAMRTLRRHLETAKLNL